MNTNTERCGGEVERIRERHEFAEMWHQDMDGLDWGKNGEIAHKDRATLLAALAEPIDEILHCPRCGLQHIDAPDKRSPTWENPPHKSHLCHGCGCIWRPADRPTNGVEVIKTHSEFDTWLPGDDTVAKALAEERAKGERTDTPSMQDERSRIEAENKVLRAQLADYESAYKQHQANVLRLDIALNGNHAARAPLLIDVLGQVEAMARHRGPLLATIASLSEENRAMRGRLALMDEAFMDNHGCFPLDRTNEHEMLWNDACLACREITGDDYQARAVTAVRAREEFLAAAALSTRKGG